MERPAVDARQLVDRLFRYEETAQDAGAVKAVLPERPFLQYLPELAFINENWALRTNNEPHKLSREKETLKQKLKALIGRVIFPVLGDYFLEEREFLSNLVRVQNELVTRIEALAEENRLLMQTIRAESQRLTERDQVLHELLEARVNQLEKRG